MINWQLVSPGLYYSSDSRFELEEKGPNLWEPVDNQAKEPGPTVDFHSACEWCEGRLIFPEQRFYDAIEALIVEAR